MGLEKKKSEIEEHTRPLFTTKLTLGPLVKI